MTRTVRLRAPDDQIGTSLQMSGWSCVVPPDGIVTVPQAIVSSLVDIGFWPEAASSGGGSGDAAAYDPGDLTVLFDNQLI